MGSISNEIAKKSLIHRLLGKQFETLPLKLRKLYGPSSRILAQGLFRFTTTKNPLIIFFLSLNNFPSTKKEISGTLNIRRFNQRESWSRNFGTWNLNTTQYVTGKLLMEEWGPLKFTFKISRTKNRIVYQQTQLRFLGFGLPLALFGKVMAVEKVLSNNIHLGVDLKSPLWGRIFAYRGIMKNFRNWKKY